jgi:hypothetical protein
MISELSPIRLKELTGPNPSSRFSGASVRRRMSGRLSHTGKVVVDMEGIESVSEPFVDECFSKLNRDFGYRLIGDRAILKNASPYVESRIISILDWSNDQSLEIYL